MRIRGWRPFWVALFAALLVLLPLAGGTVLLTHTQLRSNRVQAAESQSGIAIKLPKETDRLSVLLCTASDEPEFMLLYLNASQNCINLLALPNDLAVPYGSGEATLAACYASAGPARCREGLSAAFSLPEDTLYLALSPSLLEKLAGSFGYVSVSLLGALNTQELEQAGQTGAAQELDARDALTLTASLSQAGLPSVRRAAARAAVWDAFFRQKLELLPAALPAALRQNSSALLTDFSAQDYYLLEDTLEFLANNSAPVQSAALPAEFDSTRGVYTASDASRAAIQALFNVSPTSEQAESDSAP